MVYAAQAFLIFRNTARRDGVQGNIQTKFSQSAMYGTPEAIAITTRAGEPALSVTSRFINQADRDQFWADLDTFLGTGVNGPIAGSRAWTHDCPHDEAVGACVLSTERTW